MPQLHSELSTLYLVNSIVIVLFFGEELFQTHSFFFAEYRNVGTILKCLMYDFPEVGLFWIVFSCRQNSKLTSTSCICSNGQQIQEPHAFTWMFAPNHFVLSLMFWFIKMWNFLWFLWPLPGLLQVFLDKKMDPQIWQSSMFVTVTSPGRPFGTPNFEGWRNGSNRTHSHESSPWCSKSWTCFPGFSGWVISGKNVSWHHPPPKKKKKN